MTIPDAEGDDSAQHQVNSLSMQPSEINKRLMADFAANNSENIADSSASKSALNDVAEA